MVTVEVPLGAVAGDKLSLTLERDMGARQYSTTLPPAYAGTAAIALQLPGATGDAQPATTAAVDRLSLNGVAIERAKPTLEEQALSREQRQRVDSFLHKHSAPNERIELKATADLSAYRVVGEEKRTCRWGFWAIARTQTLYRGVTASSAPLTLCAKPFVLSGVQLEFLLEAVSEIAPRSRRDRARDRAEPRAEPS